MEPILDFSELLPKALLSARADAIVAADRGGIIRFWGPGAQRIFGHSAAGAFDDRSRPRKRH
jgi:PAS domain-containing protein